MSPRSRPKKSLEILRVRSPRRVFGRRDFEISARSRSESRQDLSEILGEFLATEILRSRQDLGEILGEFLATEILRSRQDLGEILGEFLDAKILKSRRDPRRDLGGQKFAENLAEILARSR